MNTISGGCITNVNTSSVDIENKYQLIKSEYSENSFIYYNNLSLPENNLYITKEIIIILNGEIYNYDDLLLNPKAEKHESFFTLLEFKYRNNDLPSIINKLDGVFNIIIIDKLKEEIILITDRNGLKLLYIYFDTNHFLWSNSVSELITLFKDKNKLKIKPSSIEMFMQFGYLLGNQTYFENIILTNPASIYNYKFKNNILDSFYYWTWDKIKPQKIDFETATVHASELFNSAVMNRFSEKERIGISLSGGLDSRFIVSAIAKNIPDYKGFLHTFGLNNCLDIKIAQTIANKLNWHHKLYFLNNLNLIDKRESMVFQTDGMFDMQHMHGLEFIDDLKNYIDINLNGYAGEVVMGGNYLKSENYLNKPINKDIAFHFYNDYYLFSEFNNRYIETNHIDPYILMNRGRRMANMPLQANAEILIQRLPFMDNKLIDFVYSLPDEFRYNNKIYFHVLLKYHKELFENIPWQQTELPIDKEYSLKFNFFKYFNKIISKIGIKKQSKNYIDYVKYLEEFDIKPIYGVENFFRKLTLKLYFEKFEINPFNPQN
jgi:asparagine synthase (glutamine-hydrolysing)